MDTEERVVSWVGRLVAPAYAAGLVSGAVLLAAAQLLARLLAVRAVDLLFLP